MSREPSSEGNRYRAAGYDPAQSPPPVKKQQSEPKSKKPPRVRVEGARAMTKWTKTTERLTDEDREVIRLLVEKGWIE